MKKSIYLVIASIIIMATCLHAAPYAVTDLTATTGSAPGSVVLNWTYLGPADLTYGGTYYIQYSSWTNDTDIVWSTGSAQINVSTTATTSFALREYTCYGLGNGVTSYFRVWLSSNSSDSLDLSDISNGATNYAKPYVIDTAPLSTTGLVIVSTGASSVRLNWTLVNDPGILGYTIYRSSSPNTKEYSYVNTVNNSTTYYYENGLQSDVTYYYVVRSSDAIQQSSSIQMKGSTYLATSAHSALNQSKSLSVSFWMNPDDTSNFQVIAAKDWNNGWVIALPWNEGAGAAGKVMIFTQGRAVTSATGVGKITKNVWQHVVATYDNVSKDLKVYVNGNLEANLGSVNSIGADYNTGLWIGRNNAVDNPYYGLLDDLIIYNRALSDQEIQQIYSNNSIPSYGMVAWHKMSNVFSSSSESDTMGVCNATVNGVKIWSQGRNGAPASKCPSGELDAGPSLKYPQDNSWTNLTEADWSDVSGAINYNLQVAINPSFAAPAQDSVFAVSQGAFSGLNEDTAYWWRARANKGDDIYTQWSSTKAFRLDYTKPTVASIEAQKNDASWIDATTIYVDTYPVNVRGAVQDTYSGLRAGQTEVVASSSCVMLLHMNEGSGTALADVSGNGNNGTVESGASWTTGRFSNGLSFNGTTSSATVSNSATLAPANITAEAWIYPTGKDGEQSILDKRSGGGFNIAMWGTSGSYDIWANMCDASSNQVYAKAFGGVSANRWTHVAVTYDGSYIRLYLDGAIVASSQTITTLDITGGNSSMKIGSNDTWGIFYQGKMDEVAVFNRALTAEEIAAQYNSGSMKYSTNGGSNWTLVTSTNTISVSGTDGTTASQYSTAGSLPLRESGSNQVKYIVGDIAGNTYESSAFTVLVDTTPPAKINDLAMEAGPAVGDMRMTWTVPTETKSGITAGRYQIQYSSVPTDVYTVVLDTNASSGWQTYVATGLPINTYFWFNIRTRDNAGNWSVVSDSVSYRYVFDPIAPAAISNLTALPGSVNRTITLRWTAPGNDEMSNAIIGGSFQLRYSSHGIITAANYNTAPYNNYTVNMTTNVSPGDWCTYTTPATLVPAATYWFAIKTYDGANWSVWRSTEDAATVNTLARTYATGNSDITPPAAITTLSGLVGNNGQINLSWSSPGDDGTIGNLTAGSRFTIQYATYNASWDNPQILITTQSVAPFSPQAYSFNGLNTGVTYYFRAWTYDDVLNQSDISNGATIYLAASPTSYMPVDATWLNGIVCDWSDVPGAVDYQAQVGDDSAFLSIAQAMNVAASSGSFSGLTQNTAYWYRVRARLWNDVYTSWSATRTFRLDYTNPVISNFSQASPNYSVNAQDTYSGLRVGQAELVPSTGCVLLLHMNEGSGTALTDVSGSGNNGIVESGASWTTGKFTNALSFNGTTSSATVLNSASLRPASITAEAWIYPTGKDGEQSVIDKRTGGGFNIAMWGTSGSYDLWANMSDGTNQVYAKKYTALSANTWTHVAVTYDGSNIKLYVNGELSVTSQTITAMNITGGTGNMKIGSNDDWNIFYQGKIDDVVVFSRALSAEEIAVQYNSGAVKYSVNAGADWTINASPSISVMTGSNGTTANQTITASGLPFTENASTDRLRFLVQDMAGNVTESSSYTIYGDTTPPSAVNNLSSAGRTENSITLAWTAAGDDAGSGNYSGTSLFAIQYSSFLPVTWSTNTAVSQLSFSAAGTSAGASVSKEVTSLQKDTTYYFRVWSCDEKANWSPISNGTTDYTANDTTAPGVTGNEVTIAGMIGQPIVFISTATDASGIGYIRVKYRLYDGSWQSADMTLTAVTGAAYGEYTLAGSNVSKEGTIYYYFEAADAQGNKGYFKSLSAPQEITVTRTTSFTPIATGSVALPNNDTKHGEVKLDIPTGALTGAIAITIRQENALLESAAQDDSVDRAKNGGKPVAVYEFGPTGTKFIKPVTLTLLYFDPNDSGTVLLEDGSSSGIDENASVLQIFYWDGVKWRLLGGTIDKVKNTVSVKVNHFSKYAIFPLGSTLLKPAPDEKFVTPAIPASFGYKAEEVVIMDIAGNKVKEMTKTDFGGGSISWNGYDENGKFVESGVYIFKIKTDEGKNTYGMIVVAK